MLLPNVATTQTELTSLSTTLKKKRKFHFLLKPFSMISSLFSARNKQPFNFLRNYTS